MLCGIKGVKLWAVKAKLRGSDISEILIRSVHDYLPHVPREMYFQADCYRAQIYTPRLKSCNFSPV